MLVSLALRVVERLLDDLGVNEPPLATVFVNRQSGAFRSQFVVNEHKADHLFQRDAHPRRAHIAPDTFVDDRGTVLGGCG